MFRLRHISVMRKWLVGLLVCALMLPAYSLYAMPSTQSADNTVPPCHQKQDQEQTATQANNSKDCCDSLHQCNGNCDHDCSDCFSSGHLLGLITLPAELPGSVNSHSLLVTTSHNGLTPTLLLRPPCQFV